MALELSNFDYDVLDHFLEMILDEHRAGNLALSEARDAVSEAFSMAAFDTRSVTRYMQGLIEVRGKWEIPLLARLRPGVWDAPKIETGSIRAERQDVSKTIGINEAPSQKLRMI